MKAAVIGCGGMGRVHGSKYAAMPGIEVLWVDRTPERAEELAGLWGGRALGLGQALDEADAVDICLPTDMHVEIGLMAVERGLPFLVEKPLARTVQDCDRLIEACEANGGRGAVAQVARYFPEHERAHHLIREGRIGRPASVRISRTGRAPVGSDEWFQNDSRSGGVLLDLAVHDIDWLLWTLGPAIRVTARCTGRGEAPAPEAGAGQHALVILEHESGCISHCESSWMDPRGFSTALDAAGSEGVIEFDTRRFASVAGAGPDGPFAASPNEASVDPYARQLRAFLQMAASGGPPAVSLQEAREAVRVCIAAIKSSESGRSIELGATPK